MGRLFALLLMIAGLTLFAMFTGVVSAFMVNRLRSMNMRNMEIDELGDHLIICGWNRSTLTLLNEFGKDKELVERGIVLVAEFEQEPDLSRVDFDPQHLYVVTGDFTQIETLDHCNLREAKTAIVLSDRSKVRSDQDIDARAVLAAIVIERLNPEIFTSVELMNRENGAHLRMMGVEEIVVAEEYTGGLLAMATRNRGILRLIDELHTHDGNGFVKVPVPASMLGRAVSDVSLELRTQHSAILVALFEPDEDGGMRLDTNPEATKNLVEGAMMVLITEGIPSF